MGPSLKTRRHSHSCGKIFTNAGKTRYSIVAAGGFLQLGTSTPATSSVEILDDGATAWRNGPNLPADIAVAAMVQDYQGGVIMIGGYLVSSSQVLNTVLRLQHAAAQWEILTQKLNTVRFLPLTFLIPDNYTFC